MDGVGGVHDVLQRIATIESRFASGRSAALPTMPASPALGPVPATGGTPAGGGADFSSTLGRVLGAGTSAPSSAGRAVAGLVATGAPGGATGPRTDPSPAVDADAAALGARAVALAKEHLGVPYVWGGESLAEGGFDCSGLVQHTFARLGVDLPRVSRDQARAGTPVASLADARPGDLVAFGSPVNHIGIYAGGSSMVAAPYSGASVRVQEITRPIVAIRRVV